MKQLHLVGKTNRCSPMSRHLWRAFSELAPPTTPTSSRELRPRRRDLHVVRQEPGVVRRHRGGEHVRRHHHRPGAMNPGGMGIAAGATSTPRASPCSSPSAQRAKYRGRTSSVPWRPSRGSDAGGRPGRGACRRPDGAGDHRCVDQRKIKSLSAGRMGLSTSEMGTGSVVGVSTTAA